jgi:hypothetical protein
MTDFEPLRDMATFTEDMFNRIIAFQEKEHPAWNNSLTFEERIKGLPLHNLIFSNPDRDPAVFGPTVAPYFPLREEIQKIAYYIKQVSELSSTSPEMCDLYPGNGFIGSLIGREGIHVTGVKRISDKPNQIELFADTDCYRFSNDPIEKLTCNTMLVSWPPAESNPSHDLIELRPKLIIYVFTNHIDENTNKRQTGSEEMLATLSNDYRLLDQWESLRPKNILHDVWPDMTPSIEEARQVHIYAHSSIGDINLVKSLPPSQPYDWEKDFQMALLALQAKREVQSRGFPV